MWFYALLACGMKYIFKVVYIVRTVETNNTGSARLVRSAISDSDQFCIRAKHAETETGLLLPPTSVFPEDVLLYFQHICKIF